MRPLLWLRRQRWFQRFQQRCDLPVNLRCGKIKARVFLLRDFSLFLPHRGKENRSHAAFGRILTNQSITHVFDVGANIGRYSWQALQVSPDIFVFAFEPEEMNIGLLRATIARHPEFSERIELWEGVVAHHPGERSFLRDPVSGATGSLFPQTNQPGSLHQQYGLQTRIKTPATSLDSYLERLPPEARPFLKIDVEGAEAEVLAGAQQLIARYQPPILLECPDDSLLDPLLQLGYQASKLYEHDNVLLEMKI